MAMTPEAKVKKKVVEQLKSMGAYYFYPVTGGYGASGVPDIVGCFEGRFFGIECKAEDAIQAETIHLDSNKYSIVNMMNEELAKAILQEGL
jgi:Holliday junction resolvase